MAGREETEIGAAQLVEEAEEAPKSAPESPRLSLEEFLPDLPVGAEVASARQKHALEDRGAELRLGLLHDRLGDRLRSLIWLWSRLGFDRRARAILGRVLDEVFGHRDGLLDLALDLVREFHADSGGQRSHVVSTCRTSEGRWSIWRKRWMTDRLMPVFSGAWVPGRGASSDTPRGRFVIRGPRPRGGCSRRP